MKGVVSKPQFDTSIFENGKAVHVRQVESNGYESKSFDGIVSEATPLYLVVNYYSKKQYEIMDMTINIEDVVSGEYTVNLMKEEI